jgi:hypothetical protein
MKNPEVARPGICGILMVKAIGRHSGHLALPMINMLAGTTSTLVSK